MRGKNGQFYLIAAIVIISVLVGFTSVSNYSKKKTNEEINDLRDELQIETAQIVEYGINGGETFEEINVNYLNEIAEYYVTSQGIEEIYFVLGKTTGVAVSAYLDPFPENLIIDGSPRQISKTVNDNFKIVHYTPLGNSVSLEINEINYEFEIGSGINLYFIISKEGYIATNKNE